MQRILDNARRDLILILGEEDYKLRHPVGAFRSEEELARLLPPIDQMMDQWTEDAQGLSTVEMFESLHLRAGRNWGPKLLSKWWDRGDLDANVVRQVILDVWSSAEFPALYLSRTKWLDLFRISGYVSDGPDRPREPLTVFQGGRDEGGMSWTTDVDVARWFANRSSSVFESKLWKATLPPQAILGQIVGRNEAEVLVNPRYLKGRVVPHVLDVAEGEPVGTP